MNGLNEFTTAIEEVGSGFKTFKAQYAERQKALETENEDLRKRVEELEVRRSLPGVPGGGGSGRDHKELNRLLREQKDFSIAGGASTGSGTVPTIIANEILSKAFEVSPLINEVLRSNSVSGDYKRVVNRRGATSGWVGETDTRDATSTSTLRVISPTGGEVYAYPKATSWIVNDSKFDLAGLVINDTGEEFGAQLEQAILFGNGINKPTGMLNTSPTTQPDAGDVRNADTLRYVTGVGSPTELTGDLLIEALMDLSPMYRRSAIFLMSSVSLTACRKLKTLDGAFAWQPNLGAGIDSADGTLLGKRVVISERLQNVGSGFPILVGDFKRGYELVQVGDLAVTRDDNITTPGYVKWFIRQRFMGRLINNDAIRALKV